MRANKIKARKVSWNEKEDRRTSKYRRQNKDERRKKEREIQFGNESFLSLSLARAIRSLVTKSF